MKITYVTGNYGKYISVKERFEKEQIDIDFFSYDLKEPDINDIELISKEKVLEAYKILEQPCFVADSGFYIEDYPNNPGYPGAFVKRSGISSDIEKLLDIMKDTNNRNCKFVDCLTYYDGKDFYTFFGVSKGILSREIKGDKLKKAKSNLWLVFIPEGYNKTLAEMSDDERLNRSNYTSATDKFIKWYKENNNIKILSKKSIL